MHEGIDLGNIYTAAGVPDAPYPAEKLLRVLDGLAAMDTATRKAAVTAMDAADDDWTLSDPLLDAQRKIRALQSHAAGLQSTVAQAEAQATAALEAQDAYREQAAKRIREQISELEALLADELSTVEAEKARVRAELDNTRSAVARESARFEREIQRLYSLTQTFGGLASGNEQS